MTVAWIDASAGASGDMLLGALVDVGVPLTVMQEAIDQMHLGITLRAETVRRGALAATKVHVDVPAPRVLRHLPDVLEVLEKLPPSLAADAGAVFNRLAEAEASVHGCSIDEVHFHEVGALDCLADVVGTVAGVRHLEITTLVCSPISLGSGHANTEHGRIPVPVPAVLELVQGIPTAAGPAPFESTTPTGAALLVCESDSWGSMPSMVINRNGSGAGTRDPEGFANIVRIVVGEAVDDAGSSAASSTTTPLEDEGGHVEEAVQFDANVDDLDPRIWPAAIQALLDAGADDAWVAPITMKKGRPAFTVSAMCQPDRRDQVRSAMFAHTSTIGLRESIVAKHVLERKETSVEVKGYRVGVKLAWERSRVINRSVEWDDVVAAATALGVSTKEILRLATEQAQQIEPESS